MEVESIAAPVVVSPEPVQQASVGYIYSPVRSAVEAVSVAFSGTSDTIIRII